MAWFKVELRGECREVYEVEADSEEEAMSYWAEGHHVITEAEGMEVVSATMLDED
jgi:hypothetical protein